MKPTRFALVSAMTIALVSHGKAPKHHDRAKPTHFKIDSLADRVETLSLPIWYASIDPPESIVHLQWIRGLDTTTWAIPLVHEMVPDSARRHAAGPGWRNLPGDPNGVLFETTYPFKSDSVQRFHAWAWLPRQDGLDIALLQYRIDDPVPHTRGSNTASGMLEIPERPAIIRFGSGILRTWREATPTKTHLLRLTPEERDLLRARIDEKSSEYRMDFARGEFQ